MRKFLRLLNVALVFGLISFNGYSQQQMDQRYGELIKQNTTEDFYLNDLIDHLPASSTVPTPLDFNGVIAGAANKLHYSHEIYAYMQKLAETSPRVKMEKIGVTEEGRDMWVVLIADDQTINNLDTYRGYLNKLSDPRKTSKSEAAEIIAKAKPMYYFTASIHSPETGSPEMVMELAYRLAVSEEPYIKNIRDNAIVAITPLVEVDGHDRQVDVYKWRDANNGVTPNLTYWGHYVAHDNNRDGYGLLLKLTTNILDFYLKWKPTVMHDLHESVPYLHVSLGMGPYNPYYDPTLVNDWTKLAYNDVDELTRRGLPGVWTWGFYNGWGFNYLFSIANVRNSVGRFYETFGNSVPQTMERELPFNSTSAEWYRPSPPLSKTMWSLRNNVNYQQSGALSALTYVVNNKKTLLENFYRRSGTSLELGKKTGIYAYVLPKNTRRAAETARFVNFVRQNGAEVHETNQAISWNGGSVSGGAYILRMDQPYSVIIANFMDRQLFPFDRYDPPYDDVGWTLSDLRQIEYVAAKDPAILTKNMTMLTQNVALEGGVSDKNAAYLVVNNTTDDNIATFRFAAAGVPMQIAEASFRIGNAEYAAGSLVIANKDLKKDQKDKVESEAKKLGIKLAGASSLPGVGLHNANVPKVAIMHTWMPTPQNAGWWTIMFDKLNIPYDLISTQQLKNIKKGQYNVIIMPEYRGPTQTIVAGSNMAGPKIPWKKSELTPNLGVLNSTDDQREGMGFDGVAKLKEFLEDGGVFITDAGSSNLPIDLGITSNVSVRNTRALETHGSIFQATTTGSNSPITYGYADTLGVYFNQSPVLQASTGGFAMTRTPDWLLEEQAKLYPRVVMSFNKDQSNLLLSGMMKGGNELAGTPAVIDAPVGKGHVVFFAIHPFWRGQTYASHNLVFNTLLNWDDLHVGK